MLRKRYLRKWLQNLVIDIERMKYNPYHAPAGAPGDRGGQFTTKEGATGRGFSRQKPKVDSAPSFSRSTKFKNYTPEHQALFKKMSTFLQRKGWMVVDKFDESSARRQVSFTLTGTSQRDPGLVLSFLSDKVKGVLVLSMPNKKTGAVDVEALPGNRNSSRYLDQIAAGWAGLTGASAVSMRN